jgi:hypothetical protein
MQRWVVLLILAGLSTLFADRPAGAYNTGTVGGYGGSDQVYTCPPGALLAGVQGRVGAVLDHAEPLCVASTETGTWQGAPFPVTPGMGSSGGGWPFQLLCPANSFVVAFSAPTYTDLRKQRYGVFVGGLTLACIDPATGKTTARLERLSPYDESHLGRFRTADGEYSILRPGDGCGNQALADGIQGKSGLYVDRFGLTCNPSAVAWGTAEPQPKPAFKAGERSKTESSHVLDLPSAAIGTSPSTASKTVQLPSGGAPPTLGKRKRQLVATPPEPTPDPVPPPQPQRFEPPLSPGGQRLYACQTLEGTGCGQPAAAMFCQQKGFAQVSAYDSSRLSVASETLSGAKCTKKKCRVFDFITCAP